MRQMSERGRAMLRDLEGCELIAYRDGGGVWTIGVGHTVGVKAGDKISQGEADELLLQDVEIFELHVDRLLGDAPTTQNQFDAMCSLAFNIGWQRFSGSTVLKRHRLKNYMGAANAFLMWHFDGGKSVAGLISRREAERKLYLGGIA